MNYALDWGRTDKNTKGKLSENKRNEKQCVPFNKEPGREAGLPSAYWDNKVQGNIKNVSLTLPEFNDHFKWASLASKCAGLCE